MSYNEQLQRIVKKYEDAGNPLPATAHDIAICAIEQGLWEPQRSTVVDRCAEEIARAMREEHITDPQGRRVRVKHVATIERNGRQAAFWANMRTVPTHARKTSHGWGTLVFRGLMQSETWIFTPNSLGITLG